MVDKESQSGAHQSGHNSGVVHAGIYYRPGSRKAQLCREGRTELLDWCDRHAVEWRGCGKVVVATEPSELAGLDRLEQQAIGNGVRVARLGPAALVEIEPHAFGLAALHVPDTAVIDFGRVCEGLVESIRRAAARRCSTARSRASTDDPGEVLVRTSRGEVVADRVANCAGLHSDRVTRMAGDDPGARIVAFRGEYHELRPEARRLVRALIYPVPDPRFPFLGVHFTRGLDGSVHAGPNAVLALSREGYRRRDVRRADLVELATHASSWRLAARYWRDGAAEVARSLSRRRLTRALQRLVPELDVEDLQPAGSGVRAQAVGRDGRLLDDFAFAGDDRVVHVVNAPSPAATASLAIGRVVAARLLGDGDGAAAQAPSARTKPCPRAAAGGRCSRPWPPTSASPWPSSWASRSRGRRRMLAEGVHSVADTGNQLLLLLGHRRAQQAPNEEHPFGYGRERYFWGFVVSIVLFALGSMFAIFEGVEKIIHPHALESTGWAIAILLVAAVLEASSFRTAIQESNPLRDGASWPQFIRGSKAPELPVLLLEDSGALVGLLIALAALGLATVTDNSVWDGLGSVLIGLLLGAISIVLATEMKSLLIGEAADRLGRGGHRVRHPRRAARAGTHPPAHRAPRPRGAARRGQGRLRRLAQLRRAGPHHRRGRGRHPRRRARPPG